MPGFFVKMFSKRNDQMKKIRAGSRLQGVRGDVIYIYIHTPTHNIRVNIVFEVTERLFMMTPCEI